MPTRVGLCPVHFEAFYVPLDASGPELCPEVGCDQTLAVYRRIVTMNGQEATVHDA